MCVLRERMGEKQVGDVMSVGSRMDERSFPLRCCVRKVEGRTRDENVGEMMIVIVWVHG